MAKKFAIIALLLVGTGLFVYFGAYFPYAEKQRRLAFQETARAATEVADRAAEQRIRERHQREQATAQFSVLIAEPNGDYKDICVATATNRKENEFSFVTDADCLASATLNGVMATTVPVGTAKVATPRLWLMPTAPGLARSVYPAKIERRLVSPKGDKLVLTTTLTDIASLVYPQPRANTTL